MIRTDYEAILTAREGAVLTVTLNRPEARNPLAQPLIDELVDVIEAAGRDQSLGCLILTGAGSAFCAGGDLKRMQQREGVFAHAAHAVPAAYRHAIQKIPRALRYVDLPVIAAVNGPASGAGLDLAAMCDIRIASATASFAESFIRVGLVSADGGAWVLPRVVGLSKAVEMTLTAEPVSAEEALRIGLVSRVVAPEALMDEARTLAAQIVRHPIPAVRASKRLLSNALETGLDAMLDLSAGVQAALQDTEDHKEAVSAFLDKRKPVYTGR